MKQILILLSIIFLFNCSKDNQTSSMYFSNSWTIQSITPNIDSNPNRPDCRLLNDQLYFNDIGQMFWTHAVPNANGDFNQPCKTVIETYDYTNSSSIKIFDIDNGAEINWSFEVNDDYLTVTRPSTVTIYRKSEN